MKTIDQVLRECPKHDCAYVLYNSRWHKVEEHELRWIALSVLKGEIDAPKLKLNGEIVEFDEEARIGYNGCNIYILNGLIHMETLRLRRKDNE